jgi:hypothetical protein
MPMEMEICADDANGIAKTKNANTAKRMERKICIWFLLPSHPSLDR